MIFLGSAHRRGAKSSSRGAIGAWTAAVGILLGWVLAAGAFGALVGYSRVRQEQLQPETARLMVLRQSIDKGTGGDLARAQEADLARQLAAPHDDSPARSAAVRGAGVSAILALLAAVPSFSAGFV